MLKIAAIHDMSGYGRCSLTAAIPIISAQGIQVCPIPTGILSNHTGFPQFSFLDCTSQIPTFSEYWEKLNLKFDGIYTGFLGSAEQVDLVIDFANKFQDDKCKLIVDPVMGDNGEIYAIYTDEMCDKMVDLAKRADIITPNLTEAARLLNIPYLGENRSLEDAFALAKELSKLGPKVVVITGVKPSSDKVINIGYNRETNEKIEVEGPFIPYHIHGTGDVFTSVFCGKLLNGFTIEESLEAAASFVYKTAKYTIEEKADTRNGVCFEPFLKELF